MPMKMLRSILATALLAAFAGSAGLQAQASRPASLGLEANITFLYYRDIPRAQRFYEDVLGLTLTVDQGYSKIYRVSPTSYVGLVDESRGLHRASEAKPVTLSFVSAQVDEWYAYLRGRGVEMVHELANGTRQPTRGFVAKDPEGYYLEFETFRDDPQNASIRPALDIVPLPPRATEAQRWVHDFVARYLGQFGDMSDKPDNWDPIAMLNARLVPSLRQALAADRDAARANDEEIVGLDFDPFVNSQDPCETYRAGGVFVRGDSLQVAIHATCDYGSPLFPDAVYILVRGGADFLIADIQYPGNSSLTQILKYLAEQRAKPADSRDPQETR
jgi:catechol 2,3-dioxygenase-like lactoylglutathione lyase family enzyme